MAMPTIGLIADTHVPQRLRRLPAGLDRAFRGVDLILHAGDLNSLGVLDELQRIAPALAVVGNADLFGTGLPQRRMVEIGGRRIGLTHGHGNWLRYVWRKAIDAFGYDNDFYVRAARVEFAAERVDAVIFGHTHRAHREMIDGVLMVNPGPIAPAYYNTRGPQVGRLHVGPDRLNVEVIEL